MNKLNRSIDEFKMNQSKERSMEFVMNEINREPKKQFSFYFNKFKMIPATLVVTAMLLFGILSNVTNDNPLPDPSNPLLEASNTETLAELSYITGNLIVSSFTLNSGPSLMRLSDLNETEFETGIVEFNAYFDMLRAFMEEEPFGNDFLVEELTEGDYSTKITFMVDGTTYIFLINLEDSLLTGKLEVNNLILDVVGKLEENNDELRFEITATNGQDYIEIDYQVESDDEIEKTYGLTSYINGVTKEKEIKISVENDQIKVKLKEGNTEYELEKDVENGQVQYNLQYHIGEIEGEAIIFDAIDEFGNTIFTYQINEDGHEREVDVDKDDDEDHDDEEDEDEEDDEEDEEDEDYEDTSNPNIEKTKISYL